MVVALITVVRMCVWGWGGGVSTNSVNRCKRNSKLKNEYKNDLCMQVNLSGHLRILYCGCLRRCTYVC